MKGLPTLIRVRGLELEEKRRQLAELERIAQEIDHSIQRLEADMAQERDITRSDEGAAYIFASYITWAIDRREILTQSLAEARQRVSDALEEVTEAYRELKKLEIAQEQRDRRERMEAERRAQIRLDEIALTGFIRREADGG